MSSQIPNIEEAIIEQAGALQKDIRSMNSPVVEGVVPGSRREHAMFRSIDSRLYSGKDVNFAVSGISLNRAIIGSSMKLVVRCKALKNDGSNIVFADPISLRECASSNIWRTLDMTVNGTQVTEMSRADVVRHFYDRFTSSDRINGLEAYRQVTEDSFAIGNSGAFEPGVFKREMIFDGAWFELVRPLTDLPMCKKGDALIPAFNNINIRGQTTSEPNSLFSTDGTIVDTPYLEIDRISLVYDTVELEKEHREALFKQATSGILTIDGDVWKATVLSPNIPSGARSWNQALQETFKTAPDVSFLAFFPSTSFNATSTSYKESNPMLTSFGQISRARFEHMGECVKEYLNLDNYGGKIKLLVALKEMFESGLNDSVPENFSVVDPTVFANGTVSCVPLIMRPVKEDEVQIPTTMSIIANVEFNDETIPGPGTPFDLVPILISKSRHKFIISLAPGGTRVIQ